MENSSKYRIKMFPDSSRNLILEIVNTENGLVVDYFSLGKIALLCPTINKKVIMAIQNELFEAYPSNSIQTYKKAYFRMRLNIAYGLIIDNEVMLLSTLNCISPLYCNLRFYDLTKSLRFMANAVSEKAIELRYKTLLSLELNDLSDDTREKFSFVLQKHFKEDRNFKNVSAEALLREVINIACYNEYEQGLINAEYAKRILEIANEVVANATISEA